MRFLRIFGHFGQIRLREWHDEGIAHVDSSNWLNVMKINSKRLSSTYPVVFGGIFNGIQVISSFINFLRTKFVFTEQASKFNALSSNEYVILMKNLDILKFQERRMINVCNYYFCSLNEKIKRKEKKNRGVLCCRDVCRLWLTEYLCIIFNAVNETSFDKIKSELYIWFYYWSAYGIRCSMFVIFY